ncbi:MAG TPA: heme lyase CcmF/NrfE family subunit, partial [Gaiellaceae bacterium]
ALVLTLGLSVYALVAGAVSARANRRRLAASARNALYCAFASTLVASGVLALALVRHDFSFSYVAAHTNRHLSTAYALSAFWGGQEGSLLLWLLVLTAYGALAVLVNRRLLRDLTAWVVPVIGGIATFFSFVLVAVASPFDTQTAPFDGNGLTPSLQNPYMVAHPPMLYLGYVGLAVPFSFAAGAMLSGRTDERWIVATRRWTLAAWTFLGFGQLLGAHWAYVEVGWGGYYAWDPVENAALMPWLAATAFLHSVMVQERKGMLKVWNMVLVALAFELSVFGTFLTRSGVVNSIHSFAKSSIGVWFLVFVVISSVFSLALIMWRLPLLKAKTKLESALSREATFLYNNLLLVALCLTVLWGVLFPIVTQLVKGEQRTIGRPYYDFFLRVFGLPLLLLMGIGPLIAWRKTSARALVRVLAWPTAVAVACGVALVAFGAGSSRPGLIAYTFCAFVLATIVLELVRGTRATGSLLLLIARNRRRYGGYVVHAAIVLLAIGIAGSSAYSSNVDRELTLGQSMRVAGYTLTNRGVTTDTKANVRETRGHLDVSGRWRGSLAAGDNQYFDPPEPSREVAIETDWLRAQDLYVIVDETHPNGTIHVQVLVKPLVNLIWIAGIVFLLGSGVALWPDAREQRRLVARLVPA